MIEQSKAEGYEAGRLEGFTVGQKSGYQAGFDQAYSEASNKQAEMLREFAASLQTVHDRLEAAISEWFVASEAELEQVAIDIAEHLIGAQLTLDRTFIIETTKLALLQLTEATRARVRVNPFDSVILNDAREELLAATASLRGVEIVSDASIMGGCIVETERGATDATIDKRLDILKGGMEEAA